MEIENNTHSINDTSSVNDISAKPSGTDASGKKIYDFNFSGDAADYFGIWFVNNLLCWVTLWIYSPWAKVRNIQYFYGSTEVAGGSFQFTADPVKMLRSRVIAFALLILYYVSQSVESKIALIVFAVLFIGYFVLAPVFTVLVMSFRLRYSQWRGVNFRFNKDYKEAYKVYLIPLAVLGLLLASFMLPLHSEKVEEVLGMQPYAQTLESDEYSEEPIDDSLDNTSSLISAEVTAEANNESDYEEEYYEDE